MVVEIKMPVCTRGVIKFRMYQVGSCGAYRICWCVVHWDIISVGVITNGDIDVDGM